MIPASRLRDLREWWTRVRGDPYRAAVLQVIDSHLEASAEANRLRTVIAALWACPTVRADHDAMHAGEELTADAAEYRDALAALKAAAKEPING